MAAPKQPTVEQMMAELRDRAVGPKVPIDPIGTAKRNLTGMYESAKRIPGNVKRMVQNPVAYAKSIPAPTGDQIMNALGPGNVGMAGIMIGPKAKTWHTGRAEMAEAMEQAGRKPEEIWYATGTYRGPGGAWRQEIDDSKAVHRTPDEIKGKARQLQDQQAMLKAAAKESLARGKEVVSDLFPKEAVAARQALKKHVSNIDDELSGYFGLKADPRRGNLMKYGYEHPELYAAYPELADYVMAQGKKGDPSVLGSMSGKDLELYQAGLNQKQPSSTVAHELQHAIQGIEGTPRGGNLYEFMRARQEANDAMKQFGDSLSYTAKKMDEASDPAVKQALKATYDELLERRARASHYTHIDPYKEYRKLGGEAEARMIQERLNMKPEERAQTFPLGSYDENPKQLRLLDKNEQIDIYKAEGGEVNGSERMSKEVGELPGIKHLSFEDYAPGEVELVNLEAHEKSKGHGTSAMHRITSAADKHKINLMLIPAGDESKQERLSDFYGRFGFLNDGDVMRRRHKITVDQMRQSLAKGGGVEISPDQMKLALNKQGMYSPLEKAAMAVPRPKGTPAEFMAEIGKQPGFRKEEVADRKISLPEQKMTKDEFLAHLKSHAAPKLEEKVIGGDDPDEDNGDTQYEQHKLPGGTNYREVLLKTPAFPEAKERQIMELEANIRRMDPADYQPGYVQNMVDGVNKLKAEKAAMGDTFQSVHWTEDPNVLAHIRLSDRFAGDTGKFVVEGTKGGKKQFLFATGSNGTPAQAREAAKRWEDQGYQTSINQVGGGKKLLHVEEIQSDWHQDGRKKGYGDTLKDGFKLLEQEPGFFHLKKDGMSMPLAFGSKEEVMNKARQQGAVNRGVPDAPFKKSWHELATKHILNHAANNGYDGIVITPGQEQADRYDLSKHVQNIYHSANADGTYHASVIGPRGQVLWEDFRSSPDRIEQHLGKDIAQKITTGHGVEENGMRRLDAPDMKMGGEGMKGFYDKIVPDYLNKLGKPHGAKVQMNAHSVKGSPEDYGSAVERLGIAGTPMDQLTPEQNQQIASAADKKLHYFPITDTLRQQIKTEGLPQYQRGGIIYKAEGGNVATLEQMKAQLMAKRPLGLSQLQSVGANEAPNLAIKAYMPPGGREEGSTMPIGGVDMNMQPGHQLLPQSAMPPQQPQGMPGAPGMPPMGAAPGGPPLGGAPALQQPGGSNILQMTPQGQAMAAMGGGRPPTPPQMPPRPMADGGSMSDKSPEQMKAEMAGKDTSQDKRVTVQAPGAGGVKGIVVPKHLIEGNPKAGAEGLKNMMDARAQVYGAEHREPLNLGQVGKIHKQTLEEHFAKPVEEQKKAEQEALNKIRAAKFIKHNKDTLDESEKLDTVEHEHDEQGRSHVGYASKGIAGHALFPRGHGKDMDYKVINTCPGQTEGCGGGKSAEGIVDTKQGTCFAPNAESQYAAAVSRRAGHAIAKHDPAMTKDWILAHTGSMRNAANRADKQNKRMLYRPNVVDETDVSSRHVIRHLNEQRKTDDKPPIIANSYGKTNELHDPENGYHVTHSNVGPKVKKGASIAENIARDKARVRNTVMAADNQGDYKNEQGNKTPPKGSYMVTDVKRGSPMSKNMEGAITHAKYWSTGRAQNELSDEEKSEGEEGHYSGTGRKTSEDKAHYGHTTHKGLRYDYQKQHILHPRLVQVGKNDDGTPHIIPTDSRFKDEEFLPKNRFKTKNGKDAGHILMTTPTESTSNIGHQTSFTHHVGPEHIEHAQKNNGEYVIDKPEDQVKAAGKEYAAPQPIEFKPRPKKYAIGGSVGGRHAGFNDDDFHAFPEQNVVAQRHMAMRHGDDELEEKNRSSKIKRKINVHKDIDTMSYELSRKTKAK